MPRSISRKKNNMNNVIDFEGNNTNIRKQNLHIKRIKPMTKAQQRAFDLYDEGQNLVLHGLAGTGKTFCALYLALEELMNSSEYKKLIIMRSAVPTRDIGFLPGKAADKLKVYEQPYQSMFTDLFRRGDAYPLLKSKGIVEFVPTSFIRGMTFDNTIIIADEINNMTSHELDSVVTRIGEYSKIMFCGDFRQSDLTGKEQSGILKFIKIINSMYSMDLIEFGENDIVRSGLVKEYLVMKNRLNIAM